jgi:hypothetical protein
MTWMVLQVLQCTYTSVISRRRQASANAHAGCGVPKVLGDLLKMWQIFRRTVLRRLDALVVDEVGRTRELRSCRSKAANTIDFHLLHAKPFPSPAAALQPQVSMLSGEFMTYALAQLQNVRRHRDGERMLRPLQA